MYRYPKSQYLTFCGPDGKGYCDPYAYPPGYDYGPTSNPAPVEPHVWTNFDDFCKSLHLIIVFGIRHIDCLSLIGMLIARTDRANYGAEPPQFWKPA